MLGEDGEDQVAPRDLRAAIVPEAGVLRAPVVDPVRPLRCSGGYRCRCGVDRGRHASPPRMCGWRRTLETADDPRVPFPDREDHISRTGGKIGGEGGASR